MIASRSDRKPGSSPLARGLPVRIAPVQSAPRIIPARAGFTRPGTAAYSPSADHPRSRGVYGTRGVISGGKTGSSPLARGLQAADELTCLLVRIIPARAGFTAAQSAVLAPLGIIPARAGFTPALRPESQIQTDHPRSRGVYVKGYWVAHHGHGSSPLARGLR